MLKKLPVILEYGRYMRGTVKTINNIRRFERIKTVDVHNTPYFKFGTVYTKTTKTGKFFMPVKLI